MPDDRHQQAFEVYAAAGPKRTYQQVANQLGVSERTVRHWASQGKWRQRLTEREAQAARQMADQVIGSAIVNASRKRKMVELALMKVVKAINADKVKIQLGDLDRLLRLQAFLDGDGVVVTGEALAQRPPLEVAGAFDDWMNLLSDEDLNTALAELNRRHGKPAAPLPAPQSPPTQGAAHDPATNTAA